MHFTVITGRGIVITQNYFTLEKVVETQVQSLNLPARGSLHHSCGIHSSKQKKKAKINHVKPTGQSEDLHFYFVCAFMDDWDLAS